MFGGFFRRCLRSTESSYGSGELASFAVFGLLRGAAGLLAGDAVAVAIERIAVARITLVDRCRPVCACCGTVRIRRIGVGETCSQQGAGEQRAADGGDDHLLHCVFSFSQGHFDPKSYVRTGVRRPQPATLGASVTLGGLKVRLIAVGQVVGVLEGVTAG